LGNLYFSTDAAGELPSPSAKSCPVSKSSKEFTALRFCCGDNQGIPSTPTDPALQLEIVPSSRKPFASFGNKIPAGLEI
jgi:hypothetical protein